MAEEGVNGLMQLERQSHLLWGPVTHPLIGGVPIKRRQIGAPDYRLTGLARWGGGGGGRLGHKGGEGDHIRGACSSEDVYQM